jgi:hypothetical protein
MAEIGDEDLSVVRLAREGEHTAHVTERSLTVAPREADRAALPSHRGFQVRSV